MLKNFKVRNKLAVVLIAPLVALLAVGAIGVVDRRNQATDARQGKQLTELLAARIELVHLFQLERVWVSTNSAAVAAVTERMSNNTAATTAAESNYAARAATVRSLSPSLLAAVDAASSQITALDAVRANAAKGQDFTAAVAAYDKAIAALSSVGIEASRANTGAAQRDVASMVDLAALKETIASASAKGTSAITSPGTTGDLEGLRQLQVLIDAQERGFLATASDEARAEYEKQASAAPFQNAVELLRRFLATNSDRATPGDTVAWLNAVTARLTALRQVEAVVANRVGSTAAAEEAKATTQARNFALGVLGAVLLSILLAALVARSITRPLSRLTKSANTLAEERLPALVEQLRSPTGSEPTNLDEIPVESKDEVGQLARALNSIQGVTKSVADEQAVLLRKGIGDIFVNLARRNQTLLDRQIEFIDQLEASEEDPDQLENLFKLDHLATRMRRNAESLLVLAGAEPARRRGKPVEIADVIRVAVGEVEHFARIQLLALDDAVVAGGVAVDLAHLLSELMENATQFSPPDTRVEVVGHFTRDGYYLISVTDQGIGMNAEQLNDANHRIANPPPVGLSVSRSLGFTVIGRLALRHGLGVRLATSPTGGVAAAVLLPAGVLSGNGPAPAPTIGTTAPAAPASAAAAATASTPTAAMAPTGDLPVPPPPAFAPPTRPAPAAADISDLFDTRRDASPARPAPEAPASAGPLSVPPAFAPPAAPAPAAPAQPVQMTPPAIPTRVSPPAAPPAIPTMAPPPAAPPVPRAPLAQPPAAPPAMPPRVAPPTAVPPTFAPAAPALRPEPVGLEPPMPTRGPAPVPNPPAPVADLGVAGLPTRGGPETAAPAGDRLEGLTRRVPRATVSERGVEPPVAATQRSPEEVRQMLSRYRSGLKRGRTDDNPEAPQS